MHCPVCKTEMMIMEYQRIELDWCPDCGGVWFDADELRLLEESLSATHNITLNLPELFQLPSFATEQPVYPCPRCREKMDKINLSPSTEEPLIIDRCPRQRQGFWFDKGELAAVLRHHKNRPDSQHQPGEDVFHFLGEAICL